MARGLGTLFHFRALMNPFKYGGFALMLISHKLFRWLPYLMVPAALVALGVLATRSALAAVLLAITTFSVLIGAASITYASSIRFKPLVFAGFVVAVISAGFLAWVDVIRGARMATWDPTPRPSVTHT